MLGCEGDSSGAVARANRNESNCFTIVRMLRVVDIIGVGVPEALASDGASLSNAGSSMNARSCNPNLV